MISLSVDSTGPCFQNSTAGAPGLIFRWGISLGFDKRSIRVAYVNLEDGDQEDRPLRGMGHLPKAARLADR